MTLQRRHLLAAVAFSGLLAASGAQAAGQNLVPAQSEVTFTAKQFGVPVEGRFKRFTAQVAFDPKALATSKVSFQVDLGSVSLSADADPELAKPEWFSIVKFPTAVFQSSAIKGLGGGRFEVIGKLSIKGIARDLTVPMTMTQSGGLSTAVGSFQLKRLDFKIGEGEWADPSTVANEVPVKFKLVLQGVPAL